jgi:hypothetical protein
MKLGYPAPRTRQTTPRVDRTAVGAALGRPRHRVAGDRSRRSREVAFVVDRLSACTNYDVGARGDLHPPAGDRRGERSIHTDG